jgi:alkaline phosphatase D
MRFHTLFAFCLILLCLSLSLSLSSADSSFFSHHFDSSVTRIAFGSCSKPTRPQPLWDLISADSPDVFLWIGDVIYADNAFLEVFRWPASPDNFRSQYALQAAIPDYQRFRSSIPHLFSVYDDHDYGENDGNYHYQHRQLSQKLFLDFFDEPANSVRRQRDGVYGSWSFGSEAGRRVKLILLDTRYHQNPESGDLLGEEQWKWLESELMFGDEAAKNPSAFAGHENTDRHEPDLLIIASSIQILPRTRPIGENWGNFPRSRTRFLELLTQSPLNSSIILLSGDVHLAEYLETDICTRVNKFTSSSHIPDPLMFHRKFFELTSSGMTHSFGTLGPAFLRPLVQYFGSILLTRDQKNEGRNLHHTEFFSGLNYGLLSIDWEKRQLVTEVKSVQGTVMSQVFPFDQLKRRMIQRSDAAEQRNFAVCDQEFANRYNAPFNMGGLPFLYSSVAIASVIGFLVLRCFCSRFCSGKPKSKKE